VKTVGYNSCSEGTVIPSAKARHIRGAFGGCLENKLLCPTILIFCCLCGTVAAAADTISGTVHNQTTGQPAGGDEVVLLKLTDGTQEEARTKTDQQGVFTFDGTDAKALHVVRVLHQGVNYDQSITSNALEIRVFDAVPKIAGLSGSIGVAQIEPDKTTLKVTEMYSITNASRPPVTQAGAPNVEIFIPATAVLDWLQVRDQAGNWSNRSALPVKGHSGNYAASVPFLPGDTIYKFSYHLPFHGPTTFHLKVAYPIRNFAVSLPPSMLLKPSLPGTFKVGAANGLQIYAASQPVIKDVPVFMVAGAGAAPSPPATSNAVPPEVSAPPSSAAAPSSSHAGPAAVPGQAPEQANEHSKQEFWPILSLIIVVLAAGTFGLWRMRRNVVRPATSMPGPKDRGRLPLRDALKEELFQLESDRLRGSISAEEYEAAKAALNQNLQRAMERK
jgi:hypothetical protein